jgi:tripartite-type tricarboxylate transporter receptor subunit TctC
MNMIDKRTLLTAVMAVGCSLSAAVAAMSQTYPTRPITMVLPFAAGGPTDTLARIIAERMRVSLGQPVIIENVTGAAGTIGVTRAARASPGGILFENLTGTHLQFVPYRGAQPAMQALVAEQIDLMFDQLSNSLPQLGSGTIKSYAVMAKTRAAAAPDIPTVDEAGLPRFYMPVWHGMWVPKGTPKDIIVRLNKVVVETLADAVVRQRLAEIGQEVFAREQQTPEALGAFHKSEIEKWWPIVKAAGIKVQ